MQDYTEFRRILEETFKNNFTECPIKFENKPLPKVNRLAPPDYIALFDQPSFSESTGMGETSYLAGGIIIVQIFIPLNTGTDRGREIAQEVVDFLVSNEIEGISFGSPELHPAPKNESWYQMNLQVPYFTVMGQSYNC